MRCARLFLRDWLNQRPQQKTPKLKRSMSNSADGCLLSVEELAFRSVTVLTFCAMSRVFACTSGIRRAWPNSNSMSGRLTVTPRSVSVASPESRPRRKEIYSRKASLRQRRLSGTPARAPIIVTISVIVITANVIRGPFSN